MNENNQSDASKLTCVLKKYDETKGRWMDVDVLELFPLNSEILLGDGKTYIVKSAHGSRVNLEEKNNG